MTESREMFSSEDSQFSNLESTETENKVEAKCGKPPNNERLEARNKIVKKRGIIYLSTIPKHMNVTKIREIFSAFGKLGRVYLQLAEKETGDKKTGKKRKTPLKHFTEGWIEFESKKVAKYVAATLNGKQVSTRKKSRLFDVYWNIKYLSRFKWVHLSERLAYERAVHKQRLRTDIARAKREINFFSYNIERSKKLRKKAEQGESTEFVIPQIKQRDTDMEIRNKKTMIPEDNRTEFLKSLFG